MMNRRHSLFLLGALALIALVSGCKDKQEAKRYDVPKASEPPAAVSQNAEPPGSGSAALPPGHPTMGGMSSGSVALPPGHPTVGGMSSGSAALPPGHPTVGGMSSGSAALPPGHPTVGGMSGVAASNETPAPELDAGTPPPHWEMQPLSAMRLASFLVKGANGASADISLIVLNGAAGGVLANINRWQSQLGQPGFTEEELAKKAEHLNSALGELTVVDLQGLPAGADAAKDGRIVGALVSKENATIFFKMRGNAELVGAQKAEFLRWIGTVRSKTASSPGSPAAGSSPVSIP